MKYLIVYFVCVINITVSGLTKEDAIPKVTVRLVRKNWRPSGFDPGTDDPLPGFPGNFTELYQIFMRYKKYDYVSQPLINATKLFDDPNYNSSQPSVVLTHPLTIGDSLFITQIVGAMALRNLHKHYNVFAMHAPWLSLYFQTTCARTAFGMKTMFEPMAEAFATFLLDGFSLGKIRPEQISFIGFSYAATLNAYIARLIKMRTRRLTHTIFGTTRRMATVDIVLNNGFLQPGCDSFFATVGCSHRRSVVVFMFALISTGNLVARECDDWEQFYDCKCNDNNGNSMLIVSFPVNQEARGVFYVRTADKIPFTLGPRGAYCKEEGKNPLPFPFND